MANTSILAAFERMWQHITTALSNKSDISHSHSNATQTASGFLSAEDKIQLDNGGIAIVTASSSDGAIYTATVDGISALTVGMKITIIPSMNSTTTTPKLNLNSLGDKYIRMPVTYNSSATSAGAITAWLVKNKPIVVEYDGTYWKTISMPRPSAQYLFGSVPIENGGTGGTTVEEALENLGLTETLVFLGVNPYASMDFVYSWIQFGTGYAWYDSTKDNYNSDNTFISTLPTGHKEGLLINYVQKYSDTTETCPTGRIYQEFISLAGGKFWRFGENTSADSSTVVPSVWKSMGINAYPIGSTYTTSTNTSPAAELGGTWELIDKEFRSEAKSSTEIFSTTTSAVTTSTNYYAIGGHSLRFRIAINYAGTLSATNLMMGTINLNAMGASALGFPITDAVAFSDNSSIGVAYSISNTTSTLGQITFRNKFGTGSGTSHNFYIDHTIVLNKDRMLDEFCDKFHWKRIE